MPRVQIRNREILHEAGVMTFPQPFQRVQFDAPNLLLTSPRLDLAIDIHPIESGILIPSLREEPSALIPYQEIYKILNKLIGPYYDDFWFRDHLHNLYAMPLRKKIRTALSPEDKYRADLIILKATINKGYTLFPNFFTLYPSDESSIS